MNLSWLTSDWMFIASLMLIIVLLILPFRNPFIDLGQSVDDTIHKYCSDSLSLSEQFLCDSFKIAGDSTLFPRIKNKIVKRS